MLIGLELPKQLPLKTQNSVPTGVQQDFLQHIDSSDVYNSHQAAARRASRRYTLPLMSELNGSLESGDVFRDLRQYFTLDGRKSQSPRQEATETVSVQPITHRHRGFGNGSSPEYTHRVARRVKSMGFISVEERPKLASTPSSQKPLVSKELNSDGAKVLCKDSAAAAEPSRLASPLPNGRQTIRLVGSAHALNLNKALPSLPRSHLAMKAVKKRLSKVFHIDSGAPVADLADFGDSQLIGGEQQARPTHKRRSIAFLGGSGAVGKKIQLWEGKTVSSSNLRDCSAAGEVKQGSVPASSVSSNVNPSVSSAESQSTSRKSTTPPLKGGSIVGEDSYATIIVRPELASESFEELTLPSRPPTPESHDEHQMAIGKRLVRSPGYRDLRFRAVTRSPQISSTSPSLQEHTISSDSPEMGLMRQSVISLQSEWETSEWETDSDSGSIPIVAETLDDTGSVLPVSSATHPFFHQNYHEFMEESRGRYGRSGIGGPMRREIPVSGSMQVMVNERESWIDPRVGGMLEIWGEVEVAAGGTVLG